MFSNFYLTSRFELALQQNEIMDVFFDDYFSLADEDSTFGSKSDNYLKVIEVLENIQVQDNLIVYQLLLVKNNAICNDIGNFFSVGIAWVSSQARTIARTNTSQERNQEF